MAQKVLQSPTQFPHHCIFQYLGDLPVDVCGVFFRQSAHALHPQCHAKFWQAKDINTALAVVVDDMCFQLQEVSLKNPDFLF